MVHRSITMDTYEMDLGPLLAAGETLDVEFKRRLGKDDLYQAVVCMANGMGGRILVGVDDDGTVTHVGGWIANDLAALDFAGGTAVHINAGAAGLALALVLDHRAQQTVQALLQGLLEAGQVGRLLHAGLQAADLLAQLAGRQVLADRHPGRAAGAQVDGAGAWTRLTKIIVPLMKPAILVALLFRTLDAFRIFDNIYVLTAGSNDTGSVSILGYDNLFKAFNIGLGSAISVLIFATVAIIAFIYIKIFGAAAPGAEAEVR